MPKRPIVIPFAKGYIPPNAREISEAIGPFPKRAPVRDDEPQEELKSLSPQDLNNETYYQCQLCDTSFWSPVPPLTFEGDWLAENVEEHQSFDTFASQISRRSGKLNYVVGASPALLERTILYLLPIVRIDSEGSGKWPTWGPDLDALKQLVAAFFGVEVKVLEPSTIKLVLNEAEEVPAGKISEGKISILSKPQTEESAHTTESSAMCVEPTDRHPAGTRRVSSRMKLESGLPVRSRYHHCTKHLQLFMDDISTFLKRIFASQHYTKSGDIAEAMSVIGITCEDLYCEGIDSLFTAGMAYLMDKVSILSFARYHPQIRMSGMDWFDYGYTTTGTDSPYYNPGKSRPKALTPDEITVKVSETYKIEFFRRTGKLVIHEICHLFYISHCVYYHCLMNGTGHLVEDYSAPSHECPVCLRKLQYRFGFSIEARYRALRDVYARFGLKKEAAWVAKRLTAISKTLRHNFVTETVVVAEVGIMEDFDQAIETSKKSKSEIEVIDLT